MSVFLCLVFLIIAIPMIVLLLGSSVSSHSDIGKHRKFVSDCDNLSRVTDFAFEETWKNQYLDKD